MNLGIPNFLSKYRTKRDEYPTLSIFIKKWNKWNNEYESGNTPLEKGNTTLDMGIPNQKIWIPNQYFFINIDKVGYSSILVRYSLRKFGSFLAGYSQIHAR